MLNLNSTDYIYESYFAVFGLIGCGKSSFVNAISNTECCCVGNPGRSCTQLIQIVNFEYNNHRFYAIDTPGLDDLEDVGPKNLFNKMVTEFPKINKIIIVKKYNDLRLPRNIQQLLISIMSSFPLEDFWDYVMIVNSWANPDDESFQDYMEEKHETFCNKILNCEKLLKVMKEKRIKIPTHLKEYFPYFGIPFD